MPEGFGGGGRGGESRQGGGWVGGVRVGEEGGGFGEDAETKQVAVVQPVVPRLCAQIGLGG
jgi:hypothetical protein